MAQDEGKVLEAFRSRFAYDRGLRRLKSLEHYQRMFPGFAAALAAEYARLGAEPAAAPVAKRPERAESAPEPDRSAPPADRTVGPYRLVREIGRGGQAVVHLAEDTRLPRNVALKVFAAGLLPSEPFLARFRREVEAASRLDHPGICTVYEAGVDRDTPYIAMRYIEGRTLAEWIDASKAQAGDGKRTSSIELPAASPRGDGASVVMRVVALVEKTARALHAAHEAGLVHRDVKPGNVIVTREGEPVLLDFGLAREDDHGHTLTLTGALLGTPAYMSPEQILAQEVRLDCRTDVYSLGVTLYECLTLKRPFDAPTREGLYQQILSSEPDPPRRINPQIPNDLVVVLETAMAKSRGLRYRTALEFAEDLRRLREHEPIHARPAPPYVRLGRWTQRHPALATGVAATFAVLVLGLALTTHFLSQSRDEQAATKSALDERTRALAAETAALRHARSLALAGASTAALSTDGMRALLLAREAVRTEPSRDSFNQLRQAIFNSRERAVLRGHSIGLWTAVYSPQGDRIATAAHDGTARVWDLTGQELAVLRGHTAQVRTAEFSPSGDRVVTASEDGTARVWEVGGRELAVLAGHTDYVVTAAFSPQGDRIVTASRDGTARVWDPSGRELAVLRGHTAAVHTAAFSPSGDLIVTASDDGTARLWSVAGAQIAVLAGHKDAVWTAVFSPQGDRIATSSNDATARIWDLTGKELAVLRGHESLVAHVAFSPRGDRVVTGSWDETARVWDLSGNQLAVLRCRGHVTAAVYSPRGDRIATGSYGGSAQIWEPAGKELAELRGHQGNVGCVTFSPSGDSVLTASDDLTARIWAVDRAESAALAGHGDVVRTASFSVHGDRIVTASDDGTARVWDARGRELCVLRGHEGRVTTASFSPDGTRIVTGSSDRTARVWDVAGTPVAVVRGHHGSVDIAVFSPLGDRIATASTTMTLRDVTAEDHVPRLWDLAGTEVASLNGHGRLLRCLAFSPAGDRIVTTSWDETARVWDLTGKELLVLDKHHAPVTVAAFSPSGDRIATGAFDGTVRVWDPAGTQLAVLSGSPSGIGTASWSPQGDRILTSSWDGTGRVWDPSGRAIAVLNGHEREVWSAEFSRQGDRIVTASKDGTARIWNDSGNELAVLRGHESAVFSAAFSPDGNRIVTASADGTALVWLVRDEDVLALARERSTREFTFAERERYEDLLGEENAEALAAQRGLEALQRLEGGAALVSELLDLVRTDASLSERVRAAALKLAAARRDDPAAINRATWDVVKSPGRSAAEYGLAVTRLGVAAGLVPGDGAVLNSFGVAQYRAGLDADALATLTASDAINTKSKPPGIVEDVAFLAMCQHRLGHTAAAHECLVRLRDLMKDGERAAGPDAGELLRETEAVVGGDGRRRTPRYPRIPARCSAQSGAW